MKFAGILVALFAATLLSVNGCKKSDNPVDQSSAIAETNLFPFGKGRLLVYSEYTLDTATTQKIPSSVHRRVTFMKDTVTYAAKKGYILLDSVYSTSGTLASIETTYAVVENGDLLIAFDGAWSVLFKKSAGTNVQYDIRSYVDYSQGFPLTVNVKGKISPKEPISVPAGTISAYRLEFLSSVNLGGSSLDIPIYIYFADGYGIIQQTTPVIYNPISRVKQFGEEMVLESKNFQ